MYAFFTFHLLYFFLFVSLSGEKKKITVSMLNANMRLASFCLPAIGQQNDYQGWWERCFDFFFFFYLFCYPVMIIPASKPQIWPCFLVCFFFSLSALFPSPFPSRRLLLPLQLRSLFAAKLLAAWRPESGTQMFFMGVLAGRAGGNREHRRAQIDLYSFIICICSPGGLIGSVF